jgi:hypothetical protein
MELHTDVSALVGIIPEYIALYFISIGITPIFDFPYNQKRKLFKLS